MRPHTKRQAQRMEQSITAAFIQLMREKGYGDLTVLEIAARAEVGRTTFYRYFENKAHLLVHLHKTRFERLQIAPSTADEWLGPAPHPPVIALFEKTRDRRTFRMRLYSLGSEFGLVQTLIGEALATHFEKNLRQAFEADQFSLPPTFLARALAGSFVWIFQAWVGGEIEGTPQEAAAQLQRIMRGLVQESLRPG